MKKMLSLLLACLMLMSFAACGEPAKEPDLQAVKAEIAKTLNVTPRDMNLKLVAGQRGFDEAVVAQFAGFTLSNAIFDDEIYLFKAVDAAGAASIAASLEDRLAELKKQTQNYSPEDAAVVAACKVLTNGNYVAMFFSSNREKMESVYNSFF